ATRSVRARRVRRLGAILLEDAPLPAPPPHLVREGLLAAVRTEGLELLPECAALDVLIARVTFLSSAIGPPWPSGFRERLMAQLGDWLGRLLEGVRSLDQVNGGALADAARTQLDYALWRELDALAPPSWTTPAGRSIAIDYAA